MGYTRSLHNFLRLFSIVVMCVHCDLFAGLVDLERLHPLAYPDTDVLLVCFSVHDHTTCDSLENMRTEVSCCRDLSIPVDLTFNTQVTPALYPLWIVIVVHCACHWLSLYTTHTYTFLVCTIYPSIHALALCTSVDYVCMYGRSAWVRQTSLAEFLNTFI